MSRMIPVGLLIVTLLTVSTLGQTITPTPKTDFTERYRPQFHYTMVKGWINDPIGLVFYKGEYHIFNDHNPYSTGFPGGKGSGHQSHWSHAISGDLVHWKHLPLAVIPDKLGACWSGSGVVDWKNSTGFQTGDEKTLVLAYTSAGAKTFGQSLVYSNDRGRTWTKYKGNPIIEQIAGSNRDPKVFWHAPTKKWVMVLYVRRGEAHFFTSDDLKKWSRPVVVKLAGFHECPDLFEMAVDDNKKNMKWIIYDARFQYWIGSFDGKAFKPEIGPLRGDFGRNFYASQTWNDAPGRRTQIAWMNRGKYPKMPFNQQMSFPCELMLRTLPEGLRLCRYPVKQIASLHLEKFELADKALKPSGDNPLSKFFKMSGDLFDIEMEIAPGKADEFGLRLHETAITYAKGKVTCLGASGSARLIGGKLKLRILIDRTSIEVFANDGELSMTSCFLPKKLKTPLELYAKGDQVAIKFLRVTKLKSAWKKVG
ncbi:MAG: glycoside hydrolase family 32 protein [Phycisphaerae bacterium]|nr:glycoside hydrolase family 32 protein [Phycisphaerae bacterium]